MQKKYLFTLLIALTYLTSLHAPLSIAFAASPLASPKPSVGGSPSPTPSPAPATVDEVTENLKKRLVESLTDHPESPTTKLRAYVGVVKDVIGNTIVVQDKDGKKDIKISEDTTIVRSPGNTTVKADNIRIEDYLIAMGDPLDQDALAGTRLVVSATAIKPPAKESGIGTLTKIGGSSLTLKVGSEEHLLAFTPKTSFKSTVATIELADLALGDTLVYTATLDKDGDATATNLMRIATAELAE